MVARRSAEPPKPTLRPQQQRFVDEYLKDFNASKAALRAGYSKKTAASQGARLLTNVEICEQLAVARQNQQIRTGISADRALQEAARLAFFDIRKLCDKDGNPIPIHQLDDDTAAAIQGLEIVAERNGEDVSTVRKYKVADKNAALERVFKHLGLFKEDNNQNNPASAMAQLLEMVNGSKLPLASNR